MVFSPDAAIWDLWPQLAVLVFLTAARLLARRWEKI